MKNLISNKDWIKQKLIENDNKTEEVYKCYETFRRETYSTLSRESFKRSVRRIRGEIEDEATFADCDSEEYMVKLEANKQQLQDSNVQFRKSNRESYRLYNMLTNSYNSFVSKLDEIDLSKIDIKPHKVDPKKNTKCGVLLFSDIHCNELVGFNDCGLNGGMANEYNYQIMSQRLKKFIAESIRELEHENVKDVTIAMLGDFLNSSRRLGEVTHMQNALTSACLLLTYVFEQIIIELSKKFNVTVTMCIGNESRIGDSKEMDNSCLLSATNYDFLVFHNLRQIFRSKKAVKFITPKNNVQSIVELSNGFKMLITHGHIIKGDINKSIPALLQQYAYSGHKINMIAVGHFHHFKAGDMYVQNGSVVGANAYSTQNLQCLSRASQSVVIADKETFKAIRVDLQDVTGVVGYDLVEELEHYMTSTPHYTSEVVIRNLV